MSRKGSRSVAYVVTDICIPCKYMDCVEVCPVDCFYEGQDMLVIHPDECIDCGRCEAECAADAIKPGTAAGLGEWPAFNRRHAARWSNVKKRELSEDTLLPSLVAARGRSGGGR